MRRPRSGWQTTWLPGIVASGLPASGLAGRRPAVDRRPAADQASACVLLTRTRGVPVDLSGAAPCSRVPVVSCPLDVLVNCLSGFLKLREQVFTFLLHGVDECLCFAHVLFVFLVELRESVAAFGESSLKSLAFDVPFFPHAAVFFPRLLQFATQFLGDILPVGLLLFWRSAVAGGRPSAAAHAPAVRPRVDRVYEWLTSVRRPGCTGACPVRLRASVCGLRRLWTPRLEASSLPRRAAVHPPGSGHGRLRRWRTPRPRPPVCRQSDSSSSRVWTRPAAAVDSVSVT